MSTADDAWQEWLDSQPRTFADYDHARKAGFMAGYRRALEDAADAMPLDYRDHPPMVWLRGESGTGFDVYVSDWLRDRADRVDAEDGEN